MRSPAKTALHKPEVANGLRVTAERLQAGAGLGPDSSQQPGGRGGRGSPPAALSLGWPGALRLTRLSPRLPGQRLCGGTLHP